MKPWQKGYELKYLKEVTNKFSDLEETKNKLITVGVYHTIFLPTGITNNDN